MSDFHSEKNSGGKVYVDARLLWVLAIFGVLILVLLCLLVKSVISEHTHDWMEATCTRPATCRECGETEGEALGHSFTAPTCTEAAVCTRCGEAGDSAVGHAWAAATCVSPATCTVCGKTQGGALGHSWVEATATTRRTCSVCGATEGTVLSDEDGVECLLRDAAYPARYSVAVAHSSRVDLCKSAVRHLREKGYNAFIYEEDPGKSGYTILLGLFDTQEEAKTFAEKLHTRPAVNGVSLGTAYATGTARISDEAAERYTSPWWDGADK